MKKLILGFVERNSVLIFFITTFLISWILWLPLLLFGDSLFRMAGTFGPFFAAIILTYILEGSAGVKELFKKFLIWKVSIFWYLFSFLSTAAVVLISIKIYIFTGGQRPQFNDPSQWYLIIVAFLYVLFLSVLGEETGWRGFALPRVQVKHNALISSLIIGVFWAVWHLPLFWMPGNFHETIPISLFILQGVTVSIIYTWIYNNTKGSLFLAHIFHAASNISLGLLPILPMDTAGDILPLWIAVAILVMVSAIIVLIYGPENLSKVYRVTHKPILINRSKT